MRNIRPTYIKIHQHSIKDQNQKKSNKNINLIERNEKMLKIKKNTHNISNKDLKDSIVKLGLSITNEDK